MPRRCLAVFDCVTLVQSVISETGPAARCVELVEQRVVSLAVSEYTLAEISQVLSRSGLRKRYVTLTNKRVQWLVSLLADQGEFFSKIKSHYDYPRDPDDEPYLNLAIEAGADFLVTRDRDLLDLMRWDREEGRIFQRRFRDLKIVDPAVFLKQIEA